MTGHWLARRWPAGNWMIAALVLLALAGAPPGRAAPAPAPEAIRAHTQALARLLTVGEAISRAAAPDCPGASASLGFVFDTPAQYPPALRAAAGFAPGDTQPRILAVAPGSAAAQAGLRPGDRLAIALAPANALAPGNAASFRANEATIDAIEAAAQAAPPPASPLIRLPVLAASGPRLLTLAPAPGCGGWFDVSPAARFNAVSNQRWVQVNTGMLAKLASDDQLAFVVGHEMAHRAMRRAAPGHHLCALACEEEADRRALTYMARAGYAPAAAIQTLGLALDSQGWLDTLSGGRGQVAARLARISALLAAPTGLPPAGP